ncbi:unnamed protein product, partial [marine sediment metagenome]
MLERIKKYIEYYDSNEIDYVMTYSLAEDDDFAAVAAASASKRTKSVGFSHGIDAYESKCRYFTEYGLFDLYFMPTNDGMEHVKKLCDIYSDNNIVVGEYPYFRERHC